MSPRTRRLSELHAMMGHTIALLDAWKHEVPYSDLQTLKFHNRHNLPELNVPDAHLADAFQDGRPFTMLYTRTTINAHNLPR